MIDRAYAVRDGYPLAKFKAAWRYFSVWSRRMWLLTLGWLPFGIFLAIALSAIRPRSDVRQLALAFVPLMLLYSVPMVVAIVRVVGFRCPRCGGRFYSLQRVSFFDYFGLTFGVFGPVGPRYRFEARVCANCGLRRDAMGDEPKSAGKDEGSIVIRPRHD